MRSVSLFAAAVLALGLAAVPTIRRRAGDPGIAIPAAGPPTSIPTAAASTTASPLAATASTSAAATPPAPPVRGPRRPRGGMDVTFLVTADTHVGFWDKIPIPGVPSGVALDRVHEIAIDAMNNIPGTLLPRALGGVVGTPRGLLIAGDLTEMGQPHEWARFEAIFGSSGKEGSLHYPVYEGAGNHDVGYGTFVEEQIKRRHGDRRYSWDWDALHVVCLGVV